MLKYFWDKTLCLSKIISIYSKHLKNCRKLFPPKFQQWNKVSSFFSFYINIFPPEACCCKNIRLNTRERKKNRNRFFMYQVALTQWQKICQTYKKEISPLYAPIFLFKLLKLACWFLNKKSFVTLVSCFIKHYISKAFFFIVLFSVFSCMAYSSNVSHKYFLTKRRK